MIQDVILLRSDLRPLTVASTQQNLAILIVAV